MVWNALPWFSSSDFWFCSSKRAKRGSECSSMGFLIRFLAAFLFFSAFPLDCRHVGELVTCSKPQVVAKSLNLFD